MIEGDKSHTSGWGWVWRIDLDRKVQVFFFVMVRNTLKWACLNMFYSNYFLTMFSSGLSSSVEWECWKLPTRAPKSPLPPRLGDSQKWWSNSPGIGPTPPTHPLPPTPNQPPPANFRAMIKGHFGTLVSAPWTSSFGSRLCQRGSGRRKTCFTNNKKDCFLLDLFKQQVLQTKLKNWFDIRRAFINERDAWGTVA